MPALLGFIAPPAPAPAIAPPKSNAIKFSNGPITQARPLYPRPKSPPLSKQRAYKLSSPPPAIAVAGGAAAGGLSLLSLAAIVGLALVQLLLFEEPLSKDQANVKLHPPEPPKELEPPDFPFSGGQANGTTYKGRYSKAAYRINQPGFPLNESVLKTGQAEHFGPIVSIRIVGYPVDNYPYDHRTDIYVTSNRTGNRGLIEQFDVTLYTIGPWKGKATYIPSPDHYPDAQPDTENPPPSSPPKFSSPGNSLGAPSAGAPSAAPGPAPKAPSPFGNPSGNPSSSPGSSPGSAPGSSPGSAPKRAPSPFPSPSPAPNPGPAPQPKNPGPVPSPSPNPSPNGAPGPAPGPGVGTGPGGAPAPKRAPSPAPSSYKSPPAADPTKYPDPGFQPLIFRPNPLTPNPLTPTKFTPNPETGDPEPKKAPPLTSPPKSPDPTPTPTDDLGKQIKDLLGPITILLAGITALVHPDALKKAANAGSCQSFAPGGCNAGITNNAQAAATNSANNGTLLASIIAFLQALQAAFMVPILAGVNLINTKLGPLMSGVGGIGGFLGRVSKSMGVDRALNLIAIAANLHNAMMLSANLKVTLLEMLSSVGNATGLLQTPDNENVDLNQVFNAGIETVLIKILGVDSYAGLKVGLRKYNAIYQAASNSLNAVSSMFNSMGNVIEQGAENTGRIGNALKGAGAVSEKAYQWMAEKFDAKSNKFIQFQSKIGEVTQFLETVNEIAETVVEGQQAATEFQKANKDFVEAVKAAKKENGIENKAVQVEADKAKENATKDPTGELETGLLSFLSN